MLNLNDKLTLSFKLAAVVAAAMLTTGCISAKAGSGTPAPVSQAPSGPTDWTVVAGDHLWGIAAKERIYNFPEKWPLIYKSNLSQIKDADLIHPGQVLSIPRDSSQGEIDAAIKHAKTRGAWAVGPVEDSDQAYAGS